MKEEEQGEEQEDKNKNAKNKVGPKLKLKPPLVEAIKAQLI
jgi:hypothetical protein